VLGGWTEAPGRGYALGIDESGALALRIGDGEGHRSTVSSGHPLLERHWYLVAASYDAASGQAWVAQRPLHRYGRFGDTTAEAAMVPPVRPAPADGFRIAASFWPAGERGSRGTRGLYNGKIDSPAVAARALAPTECAALLGDAAVPPLGDAVVARWDFSREIPTTRVIDASLNARHGETVNLPTRAMKGWNWDGSEYNWTHKPEHYGAIHFHDDDLYDCAWETDFVFEVPEELPSGLYCAHLVQGADEDHVPFVVRPRRGTARAELALLLPTASYWAYSNSHHHLEWREGENIRGVFTLIDATTLFLHEHPELGCSMYDRHSDGSGVCYSSRLRPVLNMRPKERLWQLPADTHIIDWLEEKGIAFDLLTEDDLDAEGEALLAPYQAVAG
jgi:N,N-dimethylformamidase